MLAGSQCRVADGIGLAVVSGLAVAALYGVGAAVYFGLPISGLLRWTLLLILPTAALAAVIAASPPDAGSLRRTGGTGCWPSRPGSS